MIEWDCIIPTTTRRSIIRQMVVPMYTDAIVFYGNEEEEEDASNVDDETTRTTIRSPSLLLLLLEPLLTGFCYFLRQTQDPSLLEQAAQTIGRNIHTNDDTLPTTTTTVSSEQQQEHYAIHDILYQMITTTLSSTTTKGKKELELLPTMMALGYSLERLQQQQQQKNTDPNRDTQQQIVIRWRQVLVDYTTTHFPDATEMMILLPGSRPTSHGGLLLAVWSMETTESPILLLPTLLLKLKSHPDRMLSTLYGYIQQSSSSFKKKNNIHSVLHLPIIPEEYMSVLFKQLTHVERTMNRLYAHCILYTWAMNDILTSNRKSSQNSGTFVESTTDIVASAASWTAICHYMTNQMKPIPTVSVARIAIYQFLEQLAIGYQANNHRNENDTSWRIPIELVNDILLFLYNMLQKEIKSDVRIFGFQAVTEWIILYKTMERHNGSGDAGIASNAYEAILQEFVRAPLQQQQSTTSGSTKKLSDSVIPLLTLFVKRVVDTDSVLSSIVTDIWIPNDKSWDKTIETIVTTGSLKKSTLTDAVLLLYLTMLYYRNYNIHTNGNNPKSIPVWIQKIMAAGNTNTVNATTALASKNADTNVSFFWNIMDVITSNVIINTLVPRMIALYSECGCLLTTTTAPKGKIEMPSVLFLVPKSNEPTLISNMIALCIMTPFTMVVNPALNLTPSLPTKKRQPEYSRHYASHAITACVTPILQYHPIAGIAFVHAIFDHINQTSIHIETMLVQMNATREARESETNMKLSIAKGNSGGFDSNTVRYVTKTMVQEETFSKVVWSSDDSTMIWGKVLILTHVGTSIQRMFGPQRASLIVSTSNIIRALVKQQKKSDESMDNNNELHRALSAEILIYLTRSPKPVTDDDNGEKSSSVSNAVHRAALSLMVSLGRLAVNNDEHSDGEVASFCKNLCVKHIAPLLAEQLRSTQKLIDDLTIADIDLFLSPMGTLFITEKAAAVGVVKNSGKRLTEEEEWEEQLKKEIAEKKQGATGSSIELSQEDKKIVLQQDVQRQRISTLIHVEYVRVLDAIRFICMSDIEIGNDCLPVVGDIVVSAAVSTSYAFRCISCLTSKSLEALTTLGCCVYEIHEDYARSISSALAISHRTLIKSKSESYANKSKDIVSLPSPCTPVSTVISEMQSYGDTLSGSSFVFLFPIIKAALFGPRTSIGCEGALNLLHQHTALFCGDLMDANVSSIRKDMVIAILELLKHDRSQTFQNPTPIEALCACYITDVENPSDSPAFTVAELAPLLDDRGALGSKNCRLGAMFALSWIAERHGKMLKTNLLVENRIWLNCFDRDNDVKAQARKAWATVNGVDYELLATDESAMPRPSPLYAPPLLSLLSHADSSIAVAAADAYARAMAMHVNSTNRNIAILCTTYIDNFPTPATGASEISKSTPSSTVIKGKPLSSIAPTPKKIIMGLPKAKAPPKSALAIAGIGQPKTAVKKKSLVTSAILKPKQERTLDQATLDSQFKMTTPVEAEKEKDSIEKIAIRKGVLRAIGAFSTSSVKVRIDEESLKLLTSFLIAYGIADENVSVQGAARDTLRDVVASNGGSDEAISFLLPLLEGVLKTGAADESTLGSLSKLKVPKSVVASDRRKEGTVVALGSVALHLQGQENDAKVESSVDMLIDALKTPSEEVQSSVAEALAKLMKKGQTQVRIETLLSNLLRDCLHGDSLALRRGAAYGLAAAVKGSGITTLKKYEIVKQLEEACSKGNTNSKEGSLFAIELLSSRLGLLFEPYVIVLLPSLLQAFSDNSDYVRNAANHTTGLIMSKLSAHGVKLVMPAVLSAFNDPAWRTKQASIHMLGAMSHLAPKQLASALPKVVPKLTEAFSDTHAKVKASAQEALNEISTVVKNPEIASICPTLLKALTDPADYTSRALEALIATEFLHAIDSPSLALIAPILHRGLRDRGATTKRASSLITGNICSMINDPKDFVPYLPTLLPDLQASLLDPIPDVRSTSAHALGSLTRSLGEVILLELRPWLIERLRDENCSSAERSGAAQGLTEVLIAAGSAMVEGTMRTEIIPLRSHPSASTREGVLWMLTFLPPSMGQGFTPLIDVTLPALIGGLSDDSEVVRDVALRAGRVLIRSHGKVHVDKILPSLEAGLSSDDHRIRIASLSLLGDLLSLIGGTQLAKGESDTQDDIRKAERAQAQIALVLGAESRRRVLSGLYMARSDSVHMVRQSAIQVWKTVVSVTVRALRDILPVLVARIIDDLASGHYERTEIAGRCLGDIVGKLGDSVLPQIIPVLRKALYDGDENTKRGVCVGLTEVIQCSNKEQTLRFLEIIIPVVRDALSDDSEIVRKMAATSFQSLYAAVGSRVMDEIVPTFMVALETGEHDESSRMRALNGLTGILGVRSRELLPYIIPRLIKRPITTNQAEVLAGIARVTGSTIHFHFSAIIPALIYELSDADGKDDTKEQALRLCSRAICGSVDTIGVNWLFSEIVAKCGSDKASLRRESCRLLDCAILERKCQ